MDTTPVSLLEQLRRPADPAAWNRFVALYTPLLYRWARGTGLGRDDADLMQDVFVILLQHLPSFQYDPGRSFRGWLKTVLLNKWRERLRKRRESSLHDNGAAVEEQAVPDDAVLFAEAEYRQHLARRALELMRSEFQSATWQACWATTVEGLSAGDVAQELGLTVEAVWAAKSRVLRRLRSELQRLLK
jgi:RNA polymerase sigma-70 factor, ECF subfamily